jgi:hypothetical protein
MGDVKNCSLWSGQLAQSELTTAVMAIINNLLPTQSLPLAPLQAYCCFIQDATVFAIHTATTTITLLSNTTITTAH